VDTKHQVPRWQRDFERFLPLKSQFVLSGNVRDLQVVEVQPGAVTAQALNQCVAAALKRAGYAQTLLFQPLAGFPSSPRRALRRRRSRAVERAWPGERRCTGAGRCGTAGKWPRPSRTPPGRADCAHRRLCRSAADQADRPHGCGAPPVHAGTGSVAAGGAQAVGRRAQALLQHCHLDCGEGRRPSRLVHRRQPSPSPYSRAAAGQPGPAFAGPRAPEATCGCLASLARDAQESSGRLRGRHRGHASGRRQCHFDARARPSSTS